MPAEAAHEKFDAGVGAVEPAPHRAGHHERDRKRIEENRPPDRLATHTLIDGDGKREPDREGQDDIEGAEVEEVAVGDLPAMFRPEIEIGLQADEPVSRQHRAVGHRDIERPGRETKDIDKARDRDGAMTSNGIQALSASRPGADVRRASIPDVRHRSHVLMKTAAAEFLRGGGSTGYFCASTASAIAFAASSGGRAGGVHEGCDHLEDRAAILLQDRHVMRHRAHQHAVGDRGLQGLLRKLLARVETFEQVDVEAGGNRAFGLIKNGLELRRHDEVREQLLAPDVVRILLLEEDDRSELRMKPVLRSVGACAQLVVFRRLP